MTDRHVLSLCVVLLLLLHPFHLSSQDSDEKPIISVLDFSTSGISQAEIDIFIDYISSHILEIGKYRVIDRMQRDAILKEIEFSQFECTDEECQLEIGKILAASHIIGGSLGKMGDRFILNIKLIDVETGETVTTASEKYNSINDLIDDSKRLTYAFLDTVYVEEEKVAEKPKTEEEVKPAAPRPLYELQPIIYTPRQGLFTKEFYLFMSTTYSAKTLSGYQALLTAIQTVPSLSEGLNTEIEETLKSIRTGKILNIGGWILMIGGEVLALQAITSSSSPATTSYDSQDPLAPDTVNGTTEDTTRVQVIAGTVLMLSGLVCTIIGAFRIQARPEKIVNRFNMEMVYTQR